MRTIVTLALVLATTGTFAQEAADRCQPQEKALAHALYQYWLATDPMDVPYGDPYIVSLANAVGDAHWERNKCVDEPELAKKRAWPNDVETTTTTASK